ncbi:unnamed protein product, partial [Amoebophrya sp. A120]|eukprot:GSA120T00009507001.1
MPPNKRKAAASSRRDEFQVVGAVTLLDRHMSFADVAAPPSTGGLFPVAQVQDGISFAEGTSSRDNDYSNANDNDNSDEDQQQLYNGVENMKDSATSATAGSSSDQVQHLSIGGSRQRVYLPAQMSQSGPGPALQSVLQREAQRSMAIEDALRSKKLQRQMSPRAEAARSRVAAQGEPAVALGRKSSRSPANRGATTSNRKLQSTRASQKPAAEDLQFQQQSLVGIQDIARATKVAQIKLSPRSAGKSKIGGKVTINTGAHDVLAPVFMSRLDIKNTNTGATTSGDDVMEGHTIEDVMQREKLVHQNDQQPGRTFATQQADQLQSSSRKSRSPSSRKSTRGAKSEVVKSTYGTQSQQQPPSTTQEIDAPRRDGPAPGAGQRPAKSKIYEVQERFRSEQQILSFQEGQVGQQSFDVPQNQLQAAGELSKTNPSASPPRRPTVPQQKVTIGKDRDRATGMKSNKVKRAGKDSSLAEQQ